MAAQKAANKLKVVSVGLPPSRLVCDYFGRRLAMQKRRAAAKQDHRSTEGKPDEKRRPVPAVE